MRRGVAVIAGALMLIVGAGVSHARSPLVGQLNGVATRYHEDPTRLDALREGLEQAVRDDPDAANFTALSRVCFLWGDVRAKNDDEKLAAYERGRQAGQRAVELEPRQFLGHLWYAINTARWGQTKGVVRSLFLLPTVREEIETILDLNPRSARGRALAGNVLMEVPGFAGGDRARAEKQFRWDIEADPHFTSLRVDLARLLIAGGRYGEARQELTRVLEERTPTNVADWTVKDRPRARELLESLRDKK